MTTVFNLLEKLHRYVLRLTQNAAVAEDIVQETYLRWVDQEMKAATPIPRDQQRAWMYCAARNMAMDYFRTVKIEREGQAEWFARAAARVDENPEITAQRKEEMELLLEKLQQLSPRHQEAVRLKFQEKLSYDEIATVLAVPRTTVAWLLHEAVCSLREQLGMRNEE